MKKTLLYDWHISNTANMANFGGYEMPLWYPSGVKEEHLAVLQTAGIFDTSHMAVMTITGKGAFDVLQYCFSKDLTKCIGKNANPIEPGRCVYGVFLDEKANVIDDTLVYMIAKDYFMVVVNAGMGEKIENHLKNFCKNDEVVFKNFADKLGKMDVQGKNAAKIMQKLLKDPEKVFEKMPYFSHKGFWDDSIENFNNVYLKDGTCLMLSRTGYTGEFGFEMFVDINSYKNLWDQVVEAGKEFDAVVCGLAARDSLRGGAVLPLSHQDIGHWPFLNNPWDFALPYDKNLEFTKDFLGRNALKDNDCLEYTYAFCGNDPRKVASGENVSVTDETSNPIGVVLTCVTDMGIGRKDGKIYSIASQDKPEGFTPKGLSCGFIKVTTKLDLGQTVILNDGKRKLKVLIQKDIRPDRTARKPIKTMF